MITKEQLAELASLARAATPGPWKTGKRRQVVGPYDVCVDTDIGPKVLLSGNSNFIADGERDAAFAAAANPVTVLALLDRIAELQQDAARYRWLTQDAYIGECFTERGTVLEICGTDREIPVYHERSTDRDEVDAAIDAAMTIQAATERP